MAGRPAFLLVIRLFSGARDAAAGMTGSAGANRFAKARPMTLKKTIAEPGGLRSRRAQQVGHAAAAVGSHGKQEREGIETGVKTGRGP